MRRKLLLLLSIENVSRKQAPFLSLLFGPVSFVKAGYNDWRKRHSNIDRYYDSCEQEKYIFCFYYLASAQCINPYCQNERLQSKLRGTHISNTLLNEPSTTYNKAVGEGGVLK